MGRRFLFVTNTDNKTKQINLFLQHCKSLCKYCCKNLDRPKYFLKKSNLVQKNLIQSLNFLLSRRTVKTPGKYDGQYISRRNLTDYRSGRKFEKFDMFYVILQKEKFRFVVSRKFSSLNSNQVFTLSLIKISIFP